MWNYNLKFIIMRRNLIKITAITSIALFVACSQDEEVLTNVEAASRAEATIDNIKVIEPTTLDLLETYIKKVKFTGKDAPSYTLTPYEYEGDTVIYVANYEKGWELLSTDERTPIVLVSSETGSYNVDEMPESVKTYIASIAEEVAASKKVENKDNKQHEDWKIIHKRNDETKTRSGLDDYLGTGYWMLVSTTPVSSSTDSIGHLTQTKWHQENPFYIFTPYYTIGNYTVHCPVGCAPVAVGQLIKYYFDKDSTLWYIPKPPIDENMFESLYNSVTNTYTFTNFQYNMIGLENYAILPIVKCPNAAYFLGYLGELMNTTYSSDESSTTQANMLNAVNTFIAPDFIQDNISRVKVVSIIDSGYPVLSTVSENPNGSGKHAYLIDKYLHTTIQWASLYAWVGTDIYGNPMNTYDQYGNVTSWVYSKTEYEYTSTYKISMNWGFEDASLNDLKFSIYDTDWVVGPYDYKYNKKIFHNDY